MGIFFARYDTVLFTVLFIIYLIALTRVVVVQGQSNDTGTEATNGTTDDEVLIKTTTTEIPIITTTAAPETTTTTEEVTTTTTSTTPEPNTLVKIALIFENKKMVPWFNAAISYLNEKGSDGLTYIVVQTFVAGNTTDAVGLITKMCMFVDSLMSDENSKPDLIMDLTISGVPSEAVKVITKSLKIPTVSTSVGLDADVREWSALLEHESKYLVRIQPPVDALDQAIRSLTDMQNLTNAAIFFDPDIETLHKYRSVLRNSPVKHKVIQLKKGSGKYFERTVKSLIKKYYTNFFIVGSSVTISDALPYIHSLVVKRQKYTLFGIATDRDEVKCYSCSADFFFVALQPSYSLKGDRSKSSQYLFGKGIDRQDMEAKFYYDVALDAAMAVGRQKLEKTWPRNEIGRIPCVNFDLKRASGNDTYPDISVDILSHFKGKSGKLYGKYSMSHNGRHHAQFDMDINTLKFSTGKVALGAEKLGTWTAGFTGQDLITFKGKEDLKKYKSDKVYRVVTVVNPPFVYLKKGCDAKKIKLKMNNTYAHCFEGYSIDVLNTLAKELRFKYELIQRTSYGWLSESPGQGWDGMMADLVYQQADVAIGAFTVMPERERVVDFTRHVHPMVGFHFVMQKPIVPSALFKFMMVLEHDVWWCILGAYFFTTALLFVFDKYSPSSYQNNKEHYDNEAEVEGEPVRIFSIRECLWFCFTSMTPQGGGEAPKGLSGRLVASTWWLFSFIIIASYTANMAAFLTVSRLAKPILSFEDLITQHKVQYAAVERSSAWHYYDRMANVEQIFYERWRDMSLDDDLSDYNRSQLAVWTYPISDKYTKMWQAMVANGPPKDFAHAVEKALKVDPKKRGLVFAIIGEETDMKYLTMIHCNLETIGYSWSHRAYAIGVQKGSPLKDAFNEVLAKMYKRREMEYIYHKWWRLNPNDKRCPRDYRIEDGINFANLGGIWLVMSGGLISAVVAVFGEWIICLMDSQIRALRNKITQYKDRANQTKVLSWMFTQTPKTDFNTKFDTDYNTEYSTTIKRVSTAAADSEDRENKMMY